MKKSIFLVALMVALLGGNLALQAQSTEGRDFWLTLMRADSDNPTDLSLTVSAKEATHVVVENPYTGYTNEFDVPAHGIFTLNGLSKNDCYVGDGQNEQVAGRALHVTADHNISLIAANYRNKSFDVASILPTDALKDDYIVCTYSSSVHSDSDQGAHFAIVAAEDNTVVDYTLTYQTYSGHSMGQTITTDTLMQGQVWYVWAGNRSGSDFTGTTVKAHNGKKIAVFNGDAHTNIPYQVADRDQIYSQAVPTSYWGTQFAITSSLTTISNLAGNWERIDKVRVLALEDGTTVSIDGQVVHTFDFSVDTRHFYEFDFGAKDQMTVYSESASMPYYEGSSHFVETSCPCAVHLFMTSNRYDHGKTKINGTTYNYCNGDPAMIWINPIEQQIEEITFGTFETEQVKDHYLNIVTSTSNVGSMMLDEDNIASEFAPLVGNNAYSFARLKITNATHTLQGDTGFIAHVYGFGERESYGYPAGAKTIPLEQFVTINGEVFSADSKNTLCGTDTINFACDLNYEYKSIRWGFGDGSAEVVGVSAVPHYYEKDGFYDAYVVIERESNNLCRGQNAVDSIPIGVTIGRYIFEIGDPMPFCRQAGEEAKVTIPFTNESGTPLSGNNVKLEFDAKAKAAGFGKMDITDEGFVISVPDNAKAGTDYGIHLQIISDCGGTDTTMYFRLSFSDGLKQRFDNVMGLMRTTDGWGENDVIEDFQWFKNDELMEGEVNAVLNLDNTVDTVSEYKLCFTINGTRTCSCPAKFVRNSDAVAFDEAKVQLSNISAAAGSQIFVNTTDEAVAEWYRIDGSLLQQVNLPKGGDLVDVPADRGVYVLRVTTGKQKRNFKFMVF